MKQKKELKKESCFINKNSNCHSEQIEHQSVQQRYFSELEKYQEQINKTNQLSTKNGQAA